MQTFATGTVTHVRDGDTIEVVDVAIRLDGVSAPELNERHGQAAKEFMVRFVAGMTVRCELNGERSYDRVIGVCYLDGKDIGASIIAAGLARDCPRFSSGRYEQFNTAASKRLPLPGYCIRR
ncbi:MAG: thermonuclease family protein [Alphaproteobacteria bacterium]|nr:thermonuclease family protein [Alphaproteobacteria bacterium]